MEIEFEHTIHYSNRKHLPLKDVAKALLALENAARPMPVVLERLFEDAQIQDVVVFVEELHAGSLTERIRFYVRAAIQKHVEEETGVEFHRLGGLSDERKRNIASWAVVAIILFGLKQAADTFRPNKPGTHIEQQINITLQTGQEITGVPAEELREALEEAIAQQPESVKGSVGFAKPAKKDPEAEIMFNDQNFMSREALSEVPSVLPQDEEREKVIELSDAEIYIRATDRDSGKRGWGATIPDFSEKRIRLHIAPGIDLEYVAHCDVVIGEVTIFYTVDDQGNVLRPHAHLFSLNAEKTAAAN